MGSVTLMIIDHIGLAVANYDKSLQFYTKVLAPLDIKLIIEVQGWAGFGQGDKAEFWFGPDEIVQTPMHIAFVAQTRKNVDQFYEAAMAAGATDNGAPGLRDIYHPHYYGAFVIDLDGHNIEAVCHHSENE